MTYSHSKNALFLVVVLIGFFPVSTAAQVSELRLATKAAGVWLHKLDDESYRAVMELLRYPPNNQKKWLAQRQAERAKYGEALERELESTSRKGDSFVFKYRTKFQRAQAYQVVTVRRFAVVRWAVSDYKLESS